MEICAGTAQDASVLRIPAYVSSILHSSTHETDPIAERKYWYLIERRNETANDAAEQLWAALWI